MKIKEVLILLILYGTAFPLWNKEHHVVKDLLLDDDFVNAVEDLCNYKLDFVGAVGALREKDIVGEVLHTAWDGFMVSWDNVEMYKLIENDKIDTDSLRCIINVTRKYNKYKYYSNKTNPWFPIGEFFLFSIPHGIPFPFITTTVSEGREGAYEQIIHNIGDAGVAYGHALSNYGYSLVPEDKRDNDERESIYEMTSVPGLTSSDWKDIKKTYFTGSIYDAIIEYGIRTLEAVRYDTTHLDKVFKDVVKGNKDDGADVWGVMRNAISVGRFILADAILSDLSLIHEKINGSPFVKPNEQHTLTAYAKDPDAVLFLHRDKKQEVKWLDTQKPKWTDTSELLIDEIFTDYQLWHEPSAHPMHYKWDITNNGEYNDFDKENLKFTIDTQGLTLEELQLRDNKRREIKLNVTGGNSYIVKVKNTCFTVAAKITDDEGYSIIVKKELTFHNSIPVDSAEIKKGDTDKNPYLVKVKRKNIYSDDYFYDKYIYKEGVSAGGNEIKILAGFTNPESYNPVYIDFFKKSYDLDGNASDQIISTEFDFDDNNSFERYIEGINQYIDTTYTFNKNGKDTEINEQRIVINNTFWLEALDNDTIMSFLDQYFISSLWENNSSPAHRDAAYMHLTPNERHKFRVRIQDNEESFSEEKLVELPILTPPEIRHVRLSTISVSITPNDTTIDTTTYKGEKDGPVVLDNDSNMLLIFYAEAFDPDNGENAEDSLSGIKSYRWSIREKNSQEEIDFIDIDFSNNNFNKNIIGLTHNGLQEILGQNIILGTTYEVFLKVEDDDGDPDKEIIEDGCGFAITKVGEFFLDY